jgi:predicted lipoprotein
LPALLAICCLGALLGAAPAGGEPVVTSRALAEISAAVIDRHIVPSYSALGSAADRLKGLTRSWCDANAASPPGAVLDAYRETVLAFARIEMVRFGPASRESRSQRIAFWPDTRGVVRRQIQRALASGDSKLASREVIATQSAAIQGLPALELLLFPPAGEAPTGHRCQLAAAVAANVADLADDITREWTMPGGWRDVMLSPAADNPSYHSHEEAAAALVRALLTALQIIREQELTPRLKAAESSRAAAGLPFERSGLSIDYLLAGIHAARELHAALHLDEVASRLSAVDPERTWMVQWMTNAYEVLERNARSLTPHSAAVTGDGEARKALHQAAFYANGLRQLIGRQLAPAAGLLIGFNELDGD